MAPTEHTRPEPGPSTVAKIVATMVVSTGLTLLLLWQPEGMEPRAARALGLVLIAVGLWATDVIAPHIATFVFFVLGVVLEVAPPVVIFSGFHSGAVWLVFGGIVLGLAMQITGLGTRLAEAVLMRLGRSRIRLVVGLGFASFGLAFVMPSAMSRLVLIVPLIVALAERMGYGPGSRGRDGMVLLAAFSTTLAPMGLLPATVPNVVMSGLVESIYGITLQYGAFLVLALPVGGLGALAISIVLVLLMFRDKEPLPLSSERQQRPSVAEWRLVLVLAVTLGLWATDTIHHVAPAWVALGAAVVCLLPRVGFVSPRALSQQVNYGPWFFTAGLVGLGGVVAETGLGQTLGGWFIDFAGLQPGRDFFDFVIIQVTGAFLSLFANPTGTTAIMTPLAPDIAAATGWPLQTAMLAHTTSFLILFFPYQVAPILTAVMLGGVTQRRAVQMCLAYSAAQFLLITPLNFLWWRWLGMFGGGP